jgi:hypothetical protein
MENIVCLQKEACAPSPLEKKGGPGKVEKTEWLIFTHSRKKEYVNE